MATTCKLIAKNVLGSSAASVTFSSIPATYDDLYVVSSARLTTEDFWMGLKLNASTSNFSYRQLQGTGSGVSNYSGTGMTLFLMAENSGWTASTFSNGVAYFPNYAGATAKSFHTESTLENNATTSYMTIGANLWNDTAAISSMELYAYSGSSFASGSSFYLYGITKA